MTESAYSQILVYGMSEKVGHVSFRMDEGTMKPYSEATGALVDSEVRLMISTAMERTLELLKEKKDLVEQLAELLLEKEVLEREDMVAVLGNRPWAEKTSYDDFVAGTGSVEEDSTLPVGLQGWNSKVEKKEETDDIDSTTVMSDNAEDKTDDNTGTILAVENKTDDSSPTKAEHETHEL